MKKTLVALAALSAISAFAQSSVQITGYFDRGYTALSSTDGTASTKTLGSSAGTTRIEFRGTEDLGNGNNAGFFIESDWADFGGATQTATVTQAQKAGFANGENFLSLGNANVGTLKLGAPNSFTLGNVTGVASPAFSTGVGSAYSVKFSIANGVSTGADGYAGTAQNSSTTTTAAIVGARAIRINNTIQYVSPAFSGVTLGVNYTPQNNNVTAGTTAGNTVGVTEYALRYTNGPVDAMYTSAKYTAGSNGVYQSYLKFAAASGAISGAQNVLTSSETSTQNMLGLTYAVLPALKLHAGLGQFSSNDDTYKGKSQQFGATYTYGAWDIMGQMAKVDDQSATNFDRKITGLGANYNLSKTTRVYARYEKVDYATNQTAFAGSEVKRTALGMSKAF